MKNYVFKKQGIVVKANSEKQAREIFHKYLQDATDIGVAEFLKSKNVKFTKVDGTKGNIVVEFDNEKDWTMGSKHLRTKYGKKGYESIKSGNTYKVLIGDYIIQDAVIYGEWEDLNKKGLWYVNTNELQKTKRELKAAGYKYKGYYTNTDGMMYKYTVEYTKDSITEDNRGNYFEVLYYESYGEYKTKKFKTEREAMGFYRKHRNDRNKDDFSIAERRANGNLKREVMAATYKDISNDSLTEDAKIAYYEVLWYEGKNEREATRGDFKTKEFKTESQAMAFYRSIKNDNGKFAFWVTGRSRDGDVLNDLVY